MIYDCNPVQLEALHFTCIRRVQSMCKATQQTKTAAANLCEIASSRSVANFAKRERQTKTKYLFGDLIYDQDKRFSL